MNSTIDSFLQQKELRNWWHTVIEDPKFQQVRLYLRSAFMDMNPTQDQLSGAQLYENILTTISEATGEAGFVATSGINYMAERMPARGAQPETKPNANTDRP